MIEQFTYTASPWGKTGAGWMVFQQSGGVPSDAAKSLYPLYRYEGESVADDATDRPVQFGYFPAEKGNGAILAQTTFTGTRWFDPRPGDFFAHVLILDKDSVSRTTATGFNPMRLFRAPDIQAGFPEKLKEKALKIYKKEIAWESPPPLASRVSLSEFATNPSLDFKGALASLEPGCVAQLGAIVLSMIARAAGKQGDAIVLDCRIPASFAVMAVALDLFPPSWRARTWFAIGFRESSLRRLPAFSSLTFYGTNDGAPGNPASGVVSGVDPSRDPFRFKSRNDAFAFKKLLDLLDANSSFDDYKNLVACWEVSAGRKADAGALRKAVSFAKRFPGLKEEVVRGLAEALRGREADAEKRRVVCAAWFDMELDAFKDDAKRICAECVRDGALFADMLRTLASNGARTAFLAAVAEKAEDRGDAAGLAETWLGCGDDIRGIVSLKTADRFAALAATVDRFAVVRTDVKRDAVDSSRAAALLKEVDGAAAVLGDGFSGMEETRKRLRYLKALNRLDGLDGLSAFASEAGRLGISESQIRKDALQRVSQDWLSSEPKRLFTGVDALAAIGVPREESLKRLLDAAEEKGRKRGEQEGTASGQRQIEDLQRLVVEKNRGISRLAVVLMALICLLVGAIAGVAGSVFLLSCGEKNGWADKAPTVSTETKSSRIRSRSDESEPGLQNANPVHQSPGELKEGVSSTTDRKSANEGRTGKKRSGEKLRRDLPDAAERGKANGTHSDSPLKSSESIRVESVSVADAINSSDERINGKQNNEKHDAPVDR